MRILKMFSIGITLLLLISAVAPAQVRSTSTPTYDAVKDFSIQSNPNGVWSYGWESTLGSALNLYTVTDTTSVPGMSAWLKSGTFPYYPPYVAHNDTVKQICFASVCVPATYLDFHPGQIGQLSVVRWTAPSSGRFMVQAGFVGLDYAGPTSTFVHVLLNSKRNFLKAPITGYQWPLSFEPKIWTLSAGDTLDFMVGWGKDASFYYDSTGVEVKIWSLGQK
jgi:hypothetical protein